MRAFDVGVIGAGIHGASAAYHLACREADTVVFDKGLPAGGPTGLSSGICRSYYTNEFLARAARDSMEMLADFAALTNGGDAGFRRTGLLFLHPGSDRQHIGATVARLGGEGIKVEIVDAGRLAAEFPAFNPDGVAVAVWEPGAGYADPAGTTIGFLKRAVELGVEARMRARVVGIDLQSGGGATVIAEDGTRTACRRLLIAAGPWTAPLARMVGVGLPLTVERHVVATFAWGGADPLPYAHADLAGGYYCRPEGQDLFLMGWLHPAEEADPDDYVETIIEEEAVGLAGPLARRVPSLSEAEIRGGWASLYDVSPDWQPVIGEIAEGVFVDAGTSGHGFKLAPALGRHVADLVIGDVTDPAIEQFHPRRFATGQLLAAGYGAARILG